MMGRGALRRGRRRGRRRTMMVMGAMNKRNEDEEGYDDSPQDEGNEPEVEEGPAFSDDDAEQLEKLAELKDKGIITEEEFNTKKKQILGL